MQADFTYGATPGDPAPDTRESSAPLGANLPSIAIFADRPLMGREMAEDAAALGVKIDHQGALVELVAGEVGAWGEVVVVDCPRIDGAVLASLAELDERADRMATPVLIVTTMNALDDVFGMVDRAQVRFLVDPTRGERVVALGALLAGAGKNRLRELSEDDRLALLRLTEQVDQVARQVEALTGKMEQPEDSAFRFETRKPGYRGPEGEESDRLVRQPRPPLPDPRLVRRIIEQRRLRNKFFDGELFGDPAWDILLDLTAARAEHQRVSVTSLCIAAGVPATTALRWIGQMTERGLLVRLEDDTDRRRKFIGLSDEAADAMARYFVELGKMAPSSM